MNVLLSIVGFYLNIMAKISPKTAGKHGFFIFCYPVYFASKKEKDFLQSSKWIDFEFDGNKIATYKWGHGPKRVLLLHGWQSNSARWEDYIAQFDLNEYTLLAFDSPAQGLSTGYQLNLLKYGKLINHFLSSIPNIDIVIGHSFGAFASLYTFHEYENSPIEKLIILASPGEVMDFVKYYQKLVGINENVGKLINHYFNKIYKIDFSDMSASKFAREMDMTGLIIHDIDDKQAPVKYARKIHKAWKESKLVLTEGKGHSLNRPEVFQIIAKFIEEGNITTKAFQKKAIAV